ncbi:uncharacterized protein LOC115792978 [Archocentrus centrarchus]|uniref:uncharacterized protein LOC115792978 n=1 Tax=Archocentrus centrarchus TaxID=63155 RepID=UPI0011EA38F0|nr:uncharacterized protein LOC115792978 [Archocentrus centrarchus]
MFRISLIVCFSLIFGITAKPWNKLPDEAIQKAVMSVDQDGKPSWAVEVEPPEDIDPSMKIWKNMRGTGQDKKYLKAEEDLDELYHPSLDDLPQGRIQNVDVLPLDEPMEKYDMKKAEDDKDYIEVASEESEQDWDEFKAREELAEYLAPLAAKDSDDPKTRDALNEPEKDENDLHHHDIQVEPLRRQMTVKSKARIHLEPEEDRDDLYHKDPVKDIFYQDNIRAAYPVNFPSQKKHTEPEEDLDAIYHR